MTINGKSSSGGRGRVGFLAAAAVVVLGGAWALVSAPSSPFRATDKAAYADERTVNFVRPGLQIQITKADIAADGTLKVTFKLSDPRGLPLDRLGVTTPGTINTSFVVASIPQDSAQYVSYTTRTQTSPINGKAAVQAGSDTGGRYDVLAEGEYAYTFGTKLPSGFDRNATHTILIYSSRNLTEFDLGTNYFDTVYTWVPSGAAVTKTRDVIKSATCNKCHSQLAFHGGSRRSLEGCILCHTPQTTDPDTGNTVNMPVMAHKIHMGAELPSVQAGKDYCIIGNASAVHCYGEVEFVAGPRQCKVCHDTSATGAQRPAQADAHLKNPNRAACGACHDNVNFDTGENHVNLPQPSDRLCANCHIPQGEIEFDASIIGAHTRATTSESLPGVKFEINAIDNGVAGRQPRVTFSLKDKAGNVITPSQMTSLSLVLAGPTSDYAGFTSESALQAQDVGGGRFAYTFTRTIPVETRGSFTIGMEGYRNAVLLAGTQKEQTVRDAGINALRTFSVDGSPVVARRQVVAVAKCNSCHDFLSLHSDRRNTIEQCVLCHNPNQTDAARRPAGAVPAESLNFSSMIHRIHSGKSQQRDFTIWASTAHNYNKAGFPGELNNCSQCHVNNSQRLPLPEGLLAVTDPRAFNPKPGPESAACTTCHASRSAAAHARSNSNEIGESCASCHGLNAEFSVDKVHSR